MQPSMKPNAELMYQHLEHLFGGFLDGCHDGLIEIAWTDTTDGRLKHARLFGTDEIEDAAAFAAEKNAVNGQNVYVGAALRKPGIARDHRASDSDILALTAFYTDIDEESAAATAKEKYQHCPPTCVVVTGRIPHLRAQLWWRQTVPETDTAKSKSQNAALAATFGGDTSVTNPSRVMRLGGSIAWPHKEGRTLEMTELRLFPNRQPCMEGQVAKAFPPQEAASAPETPPSGLNIGAPHPMSVDAALDKIRTGDQWHNNTLRLVAHWIARGWSDGEILAAAESLTLANFSTIQTRREVGRMIAGARSKWAIPNPVHKMDEAESAPLCPQFVDDLNVAMLPRRRWILGRVLIVGYVTLLVSPPGVGKTTLVMAQAISICTGMSLTGHDIFEPGKVWLHNNEDDGDELKRRLAAVLQKFSLSIADIREKLVLSSGADRPLIVAKTDRQGNVVRQPDVDACIEFIKRHGIKAFIIDPFIETHRAEENSNEQIKEVASLYREIARRGGCAVLLVHHTAKPQQASSDGHAGNMNTARGASSLLGIARVVQTLYGMSSKDAERYGIKDENRHLYVRLDDAKANLSLASAEAKWFERIGVTIPNGDEVGVLSPITLSATGLPKEKKNFYETVIAGLLTHVPDRHVTLNAAARELAWSDDERFHKYRETDRTYKKATRPLRDAIASACRANITITTALGIEGYTLQDGMTPVSLSRFCTPSNPLSQPEFTEDENEITF